MDLQINIFAELLIVIMFKRVRGLLCKYDVSSIIYSRSYSYDVVKAGGMYKLLVDIT